MTSSPVTRRGKRLASVFIVRIVAALILISFQAGEAGAAHWRVEADLPDGRTVQAILQAGGFGFDAVAVTGELVRVAVSEPPKWSNLSLVCRIDQAPDRRVFVIRNLEWTGEVSRLRGVLLLRDEAGQILELDVSRIRNARFHYVPTDD